jgi:glycosyltransferase involved in cell wall biosynthesis
MKILIATGIYPPALGGPAQYAVNLENEWKKMGHDVQVKTFTKVEHALPSGLRHLYFFLKIIPAVISFDFIYALDTFSVGWPVALAARIFGKKIIMRTGGDFLWEGHVERTGDLVLLRDFYKNKDSWSKKEHAIFNITQKTLKRVSALVFSTEWQRDIFVPAYGLKRDNIYVIENFYGRKLPSSTPESKNFIAGTRKLKWKNLDVLKQSFSGVDAELDVNNYPHEEFMKKISGCYSTILVSLGDISPNMILESIRHDKPFIITEENGLMDRIGSVAITVNPKDPKDIREKVLRLCVKENYDAQVEKIKQFNFIHTWEEIAREVLDLYKKL